MDRFFANQLNYADFLQWSNDTRTSLMSLNAFGPNQTVEFDPKILQFYLDAATFTNAVQKVSETSVAKDISNLAGEVQTIQSSIVTDNAARDKAIQQEILLYNRAEIDANNPIPVGTRIDTNSNNKLNDIQAGILVNQYNPDYPNAQGANQVENAIIRNPTLTGEITDALLANNVFEVVSGYKPKDDKTPLDKEFKSWVTIPVGSNDKSKWHSDPKKTFTPAKPFSDYANSILQK